MCIKSKSKVLIIVICTCIHGFTLYILMKSEMAKIKILNQLLIWRNFDSKLLKFKLKMNSQVINVLTPFLAFLSSYINAKAHNMLSSMLDPCFKNMKVIRDCVGHVVVVNVVAKYYVKVVYLLLLQVYLNMNIVKTIVEPTTF